MNFLEIVSDIAANVPAALGFGDDFGNLDNRRLEKIGGVYRRPAGRWMRPATATIEVSFFVLPIATSFLDWTPKIRTGFT